MDFNEKDIEHHIRRNPECIGIDLLVGCQLNVGTGKVDVVGLTLGNNIPTLSVVEIKLYSVDALAVGQLEGYTRLLYPFARTAKMEIEGWLIGRSIDPVAAEMMIERNFRGRLYQMSGATFCFEEIDLASLKPSDKTAKQARGVLERAISVLGEFNMRKTFGGQEYAEPDHQRVDLHKPHA